MNIRRTTPLFRLLPALFLLFTLAACADDDPDVGVEDSAPDAVGAVQGAPPAGAADVRVEDGVQVVDVTVGQMGYEPKQITLEAGVPARLVFTRHIEGECPSQVQIPAFDVATTDLPMDEPVAIEFTPDESGNFTFACGMGMMKGTLVVES